MLASTYLCFRCLLLLSFFVVGLSLPFSASAVQNNRSLPLSAESVLLLDPDGKVIYAKNAELDHAPASLVKRVTNLSARDLASSFSASRQPK